MTDNSKNGRGKTAGNRQKTTSSTQDETQEEETMNATDGQNDTSEDSEKKTGKTTGTGTETADDAGADWAEAMAEQGVDGEGAADDWAAAMAEQGDTEENPESPTEKDSVRSGADVFQPLEQGAAGTPGTRELSVVMDIPVKLNVVLGRTRITIKELLELSEGSVVELDGLAGDPLDILINDYLVAQGEVVVVDDKYGIRITEIVTPSERVHKLNR